MVTKMRNNWFQFWQNYRNIDIKSDDDLLYQVAKTVSSKAIDENQVNIIVERITEELNVSSNDNILDLCCGNGILTFRIAKNVKFVIGMDYSNTLLKNANKCKAMENIIYVNQNVIEIDEQKILIQKYNINKVIVSDALAYFSRREFMNILEALNQSLLSKHLIFLGNVLIKNRRWKFYNTVFRKFDYLINYKLLGNSKGIGKWWHIKELEFIAKHFNYKIKFIEQNPKLSTAHYRMDVVFEK